jgi:hypothetical protein
MHEFYSDLKHLRENVQGLGFFTTFYLYRLILLNEEQHHAF